MKKPYPNDENPLVGIIMGSQSDWKTVRPAAEKLDEFGIPHECKIVSAHRTPYRTHDYGPDAVRRGIQVIIAAAGGSAHLPGMVAAYTSIPVIGIPVTSEKADLTSLLSIVNMPPGVPVGTMAQNGAVSAAVYAAKILGISNPVIANKVQTFMAEQARAVPTIPVDDVDPVHL